MTVLFLQDTLKTWRGRQFQRERSFDSRGARMCCFSHVGVWEGRACDQGNVSDASRAMRVCYTRRKNLLFLKG